ncbi:MAG: acetyl-CoA acetyltransferase [Aquisalimonadaceae bacterium]
MNYPYVTGWAHTRFGKLDDTLEGLICQVANAAVTDAGLEHREIDAIYVGHFNSGMSAQRCSGALVLEANEAFRFKPATRLENACASGSAAMHAGINHILAGRGRNILVVGVEKMTHLNSGQAGECLLGACYQAEESATKGGFAGIFGKIAQTYADRYGDQSEGLAMIAAKNHRNGMHNPYAQLRKDLGFEFCNMISEKNPQVAGPLRRTDCSPVSDGAAAVVLTASDAVSAERRKVRFRSIAHVNDYFPMSRRDMSQLAGAREAWRHALMSAGIDLLDLDLAEVHDCFTQAELMIYEAMGLTEPGEGTRAIREGWVERDGKLPVNLSGGLKAKGHPVGATGVSMHVLAAMQLAGEAPEGMQVAEARLAGVFNMGGAGVVNYVSVLERAE